MRSDLKSILQQLNGEELAELRIFVDDLIKIQNRGTLGKRKSKRVEMSLSATCEVEREKEFFDREHRVIILDMSVNGLCFQISQPLLENDLIAVFFRSPSNGIQKKINCQVIRVKEIKRKTTVEYQIAAKGVGKDYIQKYKGWLNKRALYLGL